MQNVQSKGHVLLLFFSCFGNRVIRPGVTVSHSQQCLLQNGLYKYSHPLQARSLVVQNMN